MVKREEHRPVSSTPSAHTLSVAEQEGVEPIDYEEFVSQQSERDPLGWVSFIVIHLKRVHNCFCIRSLNSPRTILR